MIHFKVTPDGGDTFEVEADSRDIIEWEIRKQGRHLGLIQSAPRMTDLSELAWLAAKRSKDWTGDLSDFRRYVKVDPVAPAEDADADDLLDPTQTGA
jgi:hypothetical protein